MVSYLRVLTTQTWRNYIFIYNGVKQFWKSVYIYVFIVHCFIISLDTYYWFFFFFFGAFTHPKVHLINGKLYTLNKVQTTIELNKELWDSLTRLADVTRWEYSYRTIDHCLKMYRKTNVYLLLHLPNLYDPQKTAAYHYINEINIIIYFI